MAEQVINRSGSKGGMLLWLDDNHAVRFSDIASITRTKDEWVFHSSTLIQAAGGKWEPEMLARVKDGALKEHARKLMHLMDPQ